MSELPEGWTSCLIGDATEVIGGGTPDTKYADNFSEVEGIAWLTPADLSGYSKMYISRGKRFLTEAGFHSSSARLLPKGTVLFSSRAPIGYVAIAANEICTNQGFKSFVPATGVITEYLYFYLKFAKPLADELASGTTFAEISGKNAAKIPLLLAPTNEQRRIVAKLETLLGKVDACQQRLAKIPVTLKRFRQAVLAAACSGELTIEWREQQLHQQAVFEHYNNSLLSRSKPYEISSVDDLPILPESWSYVPIGNLSDFQQGMQIAKNTRFKEPSPNRLPILRILNYANGFSEDVEYAAVNEQTLVADAEDVILARTGETRGKVLTGYRGIFHNNTFRLNYNKDLVERKFLVYWLETHFVQSYIINQSSRSAQPDLTHKAFGPCPFPLAPLGEQQEIVRRVEAFFKLADQLEARYQKAKAQVDKLQQSILAKAFRGELVPTEAELARREGRAYEPAAALLERIRVARAEPTQKRKR